MSVFPCNITVAARQLTRFGAIAIALAIAAPAATAASGGASVGGSSEQKAQGASTASDTGARPKPIGKAQVKRAQLLLRLSPTGKHDPATRKSVKRFQQLRGLTTYGVIDMPTYLEIKSAFALLETGGATIESASTGGGAATTTPPFAVPEGQAPISPAEKAILDKIGQCESGGDPTIVSSNGLYRGKYQFDRATWRTVGGTGDPAAASEAEQDQRAAVLLRRRGTAPWPVCGRGLL